MIRVPPGDSVLTAALAAGIALPYSCRAGRCSTCKSRLLAGRIEYPFPPPGITAAEIAEGEVLLCQARPLSDLRVESRRVPVRASNAVSCEVLEVSPLPLDALCVRLRIVDGELAMRPGQYADVRNNAGMSDRLAVIGAREGEIDLECLADRSDLRQWLDADAVVGSSLRVAGPFDLPR
jgi:CDP-4-dehydro-6-deoxyglucose reductase